MQNNILKIVEDILIHNDFSIDPDLINKDVSIRELPDWDSLKHLNFFLEVEKKLNIDIDISDFGQIVTIGDLIMVIKKNGY